MASWIQRSILTKTSNLACRPHRQTHRAFGNGPLLRANNKPLPPRRPILDHELEEAFLKGSGPGGQKINKTNSAVQLKHLPTGIVVKCQGTRSRDQNRKDARRLLQDRLEELELGDGARTKVKERLQAKRKASKRKKSLRKYKALAGERGVVGEGEEGVEEAEDGEQRDEGYEDGERAGLRDGRSSSEKSGLEESKMDTKKVEP